MAQATWSVEPLPAEAVAAVRAAVGPLVDQLVAAIAGESPVYGAVLTAPEGMGIRLGIEQAIRSFLDAVERGEHPAAETNEIWRRLGEAEFQAGRPLDALRGAFRTGTRAAWRGAADVAAVAGVSTSLVISLAEAIFLYTDELAGEVVEGYLRMQSDEAGELERRRRRLASLLLDPAGADPEALARAAELARWTLPQSVAVLALAGGPASPGVITRRLSVDGLIGADAEGVFIVLPDPEGPGRGVELERAVAADAVGAAPAGAVLGPNVGVREAERSLRWARLALRRLGDRRSSGVRGSAGPGLMRVEDHLADVILLQDEQLAAELVASRLAPLEGLPSAERDRLIETLEAWLAHQRHTPGVAATLHVHPQTVRYRLGRLRELLGDALEDPDRRFELELALRARRALRTDAAG